jgi:hypothetical protein
MLSIAVINKDIFFFTRARRLISPGSTADLRLTVQDKDILSDKGDAVKVIKPDAAVVSAVNKKRSLRMCASTIIGCRKSVDF